MANHATLDIAASARPTASAGQRAPPAGANSTLPHKSRTTHQAPSNSTARSVAPAHGLATNRESYTAAMPRHTDVQMNTPRNTHSVSRTGTRIARATVTASAHTEVATTTPLEMLATASSENATFARVWIAIAAELETASHSAVETTAETTTPARRAAPTFRYLTSRTP